MDDKVMGVMGAMALSMLLTGTAQGGLSPNLPGVGQIVLAPASHRT